MRDSTQFYEQSAHQFLTGLDEIHELCKKIVEGGIEAGTFRRTDADKAASCLRGMLTSFVANDAHFGRDYDAEEIGEYIFELFLRGIQP